MLENSKYESSQVIGGKRFAWLLLKVQDFAESEWWDLD